MPAAQAAQVSLVAALAVAEMADAFVAPSLVALKWPNDLMVGGRKAAGILVESGSLAGGELWVAVGVGVNLANAPAQAERPTTALALHMGGPPPAPLVALSPLMAAMDRWRGLWLAQGFAPVASAWTARAHGLGAPCVAVLTHERVEGIAEGLDADGALRLRTPSGEVRRITAGDVFF
jgi:BirA family biotin operon repressor/biotin-[acetyl-CoA-carboxylase] ligase